MNDTPETKALEFADFKSTPRTDALLDAQQFDGVDYDTSCQQLTELCGELERDLNEAVLNVRECELEIKDLTIRAMEAERKAEQYRLDANKEMAKRMQAEQKA
jgi:hypothetical protein